MYNEVTKDYSKNSLYKGNLPIGLSTEAFSANKTMFRNSEYCIHIVCMCHIMYRVILASI